MYILHISTQMQQHISVNRTDCNFTLYGTKIYSRSRGIKTPKLHELDYTSFEQIVQDYDVEYEKNVDLCVADNISGETKTLNSFTYRTYKKSKN